MNVNVDELEYGTSMVFHWSDEIVGSKKVVYHWKVYGCVPPLAFALNSTGWFAPVTLYHG